MNIICVDPSLHCSGVAMFVDSDLREHFNVEVPSSFSGGDAIIEMVRKVDLHVPPVRIDVLLVEVQNPRGANERMKKQDLMNLHAVCYAIMCKLMGKDTTCKPLFPFDWNKGVPKRIMHTRMRDKYYIQPVHGPEDYLDAIGIGDYYIRKNRVK
jgi:hypothetical protein